MNGPRPTVAMPPLYETLRTGPEEPSGAGFIALPTDAKKRPRILVPPPLAVPLCEGLDARLPEPTEEVLVVEPGRCASLR